MLSKRFSLRSAGAFALVWTLAGISSQPAQSMTLIRAGLDDLVAGNSSIVVATVENVSSYWNADASFLLTDVSLSTTQVLKGDLGGEITLTLMGGTDGVVTTLVPGTAVLLPGQSYLLFLRDDSLPGTAPVLTVAEHCQGAFDIETRDGGEWATSQAAGEALVPGEDDADAADVPGGAEGMSLSSLVDEISALVKGGSGR